MSGATILGGLFIALVALQTFWVNRSLDKIEQSVSTLKNDLTAKIDESQATMLARFGDSQVATLQRFGDLTARIADVQTAINARIDDLRADVQRLDGRVEHLEHEPNAR
jgi:outer membrane murein-binding lipoprotein Lpp